jgi:hypothetical protein
MHHPPPRGVRERTKFLDYSKHLPKRDSFVKLDSEIREISKLLYLKFIV